MKMSPFKIFAVIPAYNEEKNIQAVIKGAKTFVDEVIVVDDCSTDSTKLKATKMGVKVVGLLKNQGAGFATRIGCELAVDLGADYIVTLDSDGQHDSNDIPALLKLLINMDLDLVFGYREKDLSMSLDRRIGNHTLAFISQLLFGIRLKDSLTGFHAFKANSFSKIKWQSNRYGFIQEFVYNIYIHNLKFGEVLVKTIYIDKNTGMSKIDGLMSIGFLFYLKLKAMISKNNLN